MKLFERVWELDADILETEGFDADSISVHAACEFDEDMNRIEVLTCTVNLSDRSIRELQLLCKTRNLKHWREYAVK